MVATGMKAEIEQKGNPMTTTGKVITACFTGGAIGTAIALLLAPWLAWLGASAGFAAGYVAYEFRSVIAAVPRAWKKAAGDMSNVHAWLSTPRPMLFPALVTFAAWTACWHTFYVCWPPEKPVQGWWVAGLVIALVMSIGGFVAACELMKIGCSARPRLRQWVKTNPKRFKLETEIGANNADGGLFMVLIRERVYYGAEADSYYYNIDHPAGYKEPLLLLLRGLLICAYEVARFLGWRLWKGIALGAYRLARALLLAAWWTFRFVHSRERVLCGVDSALGTLAAAALFRNSDMGLADFAFAVLCGGLLGAAIGALNYRIISVRLLRLAAARAGE